MLFYQPELPLSLSLVILSHTKSICQGYIPNTRALVPNFHSHFSKKEMLKTLKFFILKPTSFIALHTSFYLNHLIFLFTLVSSYKNCLKKYLSLEMIFDGALEKKNGKVDKIIFIIINWPPIDNINAFNTII